MTQKILVLDDEENYAEMLESLLEQHFFVVDSATKPELALKALEQRGYDLVISDYKMPVMDGADFLQKAREINPDLPFIIVSGLMNTPELVKVANMGVTLVLEKPIDIGNFIIQVKKFVQPLSETEYARIHKKEESAGAGHDLGSRKFIKTYPGDSPYVFDSSPVMQFFLQDLWDAVQEQAHVFVSMPPGSEADLVLAEIARWRKPDGGKPLCLEVGREHGDLKARFAGYGQEAGSAQVVGLGGFAQADLASQERLVDAIREAPEDLVFIYFFEQDLLLAEQPAINSELLELTRESLCSMPELRTRPSDLAAYTLRYLPRIAQAEAGRAITQVDADAIPLLLGYSWPGNFAELIFILRRALARETSDTLRSATLQQALEGGMLPEADFSLEAGLIDYQTQLLNRAMEDSGESLPNLLETIGVEIGSSTASPEKLSLLYPELIQKPNP